MRGHQSVNRLSRLLQGATLAGVCLLAWVPAALAERAIVVFGSAVRPDGTPSPSLLRRLDTALSLARRDRHVPIVVTGGSVAGPRAEGPFMARWLRNRGVKPGRILVESRARHTGENASLSVPLLRRAGVNAVTLITERHHMRRARFHMRAALCDGGMGCVKITPHAAPDGRRGLTRVSGWFKESAKITRDLGFRVWGKIKRGVKRRRSRTRRAPQSPRTRRAR